jgi:hypothetical protein
VSDLLISVVRCSLSVVRCPISVFDLHLDGDSDATFSDL